MKQKDRKRSDYASDPWNMKIQLSSQQMTGTFIQMASNLLRSSNPLDKVSILIRSIYRPTKPFFTSVC